MWPAKKKKKKKSDILIASTDLFREALLQILYIVRSAIFQQRKIIKLEL